MEISEQNVSPKPKIKLQAMALPYLNLFIGDLLKDTDLLSPAAFGGYVRLLFKMHKAPVRGEVTYSLPDLCRIFAAKDLGEAEAILKEIVNPKENIVDYSFENDLHFVRNRRMVRETALSQTRSEAGKKGAEKTNAKFKNKNEFDETNAAAKTTANLNFAEEVATANQSANNPANYGIGIGNNNEDNKGVKGEKEETDADAAIVPRMFTIWKKHKPKYIFRRDDDFKALGTICRIILKEETLSLYDQSTNERVLTIWETLVQFILTEPLYNSYQLSQIEKYFAAISSKYITAQENPIAYPSKGKNKSTIQNNIETANGARNKLANKYGGVNEQQ
jgi:uncharacterized protein YdaU (DUF1376 family)